MDLAKDLKDVLNKILKKKELEPIGNDVGSLLVSFFNLQDKTVSIKKRKVKVSKELHNKQIFPPYDEYLKKVKGKFQRGEDINAYLSSLSIIPEQNDLLLYDWGIHHLHLEEGLNKRGFINRSDYLLFFMLEKDNVYFIDVTKHKIGDGTEFSQQHLLWIIKRNWPHLIDSFKMKGVTSTSQPIDDKAYSSLRKFGTQTLVEVDGDVFVGIGGGISTAKTSVAQTRKSHYILNLLQELELEIKTQKEMFKEISFEFNINYIERDFKLILEKERFYVIETSTGNKVYVLDGLYNDIFGHLLEQ